MEETDMDILILSIIAFVLAVLFIASAMADDETTIELSDEEAEEYRKRLIERENKDVELDNED